MSAYHGPYPKHTPQEDREWELQCRHAQDNTKSMWHRPPVNGDWQMFGANYPGGWCVYPHDSASPFYKAGHWFQKQEIAAAVLAWKKARVKKRPWGITWWFMRVWRALPWR